MTLNIKDTQHNDTRHKHYNCRYAQCHYAECRYAEWHYAESRGAIKYYPNVCCVIKPTFGISDAIILNLKPILRCIPPK